MKMFETDLWFNGNDLVDFIRKPMIGWTCSIGTMPDWGCRHSLLLPSMGANAMISNLDEMAFPLQSYFDC